METKEKKEVKKSSPKPTEKKTPKKKFSKTWLAILKNEGTGEIKDLKYLLR